MTRHPVERTIAFVDLAGFTALTEAHGDEQALATLARFRAITEAALGPDDVLVKTIGDAVMIAFADAACAVTGLRRLFDAALADPSLPLLRGGAHHGPAVPEGDDFFGNTVNLAARVCAFAGGGQLLTTIDVAWAASDAGEVVTHVGPIALRNIAAPVDLYEITLEAPAATAVDPVCAMKVPTTGATSVHLHHGGQDLWFCGLPCLARYAAAPDQFDTTTVPTD
jgi:class 3 adenylate cyclase/YHS domain-containing protein